MEINKDLLQVTGEEALYQMFFKEYVVRRKTDLVNPKVFGLGDVELPRSSMFVYTPKHADDLGPSNQEPFISNYKDDVYIAFDSNYEIVAGKARVQPFEEIKIIKKYKAGHYRYKHLRNVSTAIKREKDLIVINTALGQRKWKYVINRFTQFDRSYNQLHTLISSINRQGKDNTRELFFSIELPDLIPTYTKFLEILKHYKKAFTEENGELVFTGINDQAIKQLRLSGAYWLIDWFTFLIGESDYSLFTHIDSEVLDRVNFILTKNGKCVIVKPGLLKEWLEELNKVTEVNDGTVIDTYTSQRINAVKRILGIMMRLSTTEVSEVTDVQEKGTEASIGVTESGSGEEPSSEIEEPDEADTVDDSDSDSDLFSSILMGSDRSSETIGEDGEPTDEGLRDRADEEAQVSWTDDVDDSEFETVELEGPKETRLGKVGFDTPTKGVEVALERLAKSGKLSVSQQDFFLAQAEKYRDLAMPDGTSLEEFINIDEKQLRSLERKTTAPEIVGLTDKSYLESTVQNLKNGYVTDYLQKDIVNAILAVQQGGVCLTGFELETVENADGEYDVYKISLLPVGGVQTTFPIKVPKIRPDGTFVVDGQKRTKALQKRDIPVRKLDHYRVGLTSNYGRKLIINRSKAVKDDYGLWLSKQIRVKAQSGELDLYVGGQPQYKIPVPKLYSDMAKQFRSLKCKDIEFVFSTKVLLEQDPNLKSLMTAKSTVVGFMKKHPVILDDHGNLLYKGEIFDTFENYLGIDTRKAPVEFAQININGFKFPIGVVLSYYFGFDELIKMIGTEYRTVPGGTRIKLDKDEFPLQFADETIIFNRRDPMARLVFGGMSRLPNLGIFNRIDMNDPGVWVTVINNPKVKHTHFKEMGNMFDYFIDPITRGELIKWGYSTSFDHLLLEATELLTIDKHEHEVEVQEQRFIGYESIPGSVYKQITKAVIKARNEPNPEKAKISVHPEAVMLEAGLLDSSIDLVQEVSPIHEVKEQETTTYGGNDGRNSESMVRRTRGQLPSYIGIISEAGKDSANVGYVQYTTSNPKIIDYRGNVDVNMVVGNAGLGSVTMNTLGGLNRDDPKRSIRPTYRVTGMCIYS